MRILDFRFLILDWDPTRSPIENLKSKIKNCSLTTVLVLAAAPTLAQPPTPPVLAEIDRTIREGFYDPRLKGVDWTAAVEGAREELSRPLSPAERDAVYDRLLARLGDSHTFRVPAGRLPERNWGTSGLRIGRDGDGYAVKALLPGFPAARAGMKVGDRILELDGRTLGPKRLNFRDLFFALEGAPGSSLSVKWQSGNAAPREERLSREPEPPGDALVWSSARVIRSAGKAYGYAHLWGMSAETALAVVDLLLDRAETERVRPSLAGWSEIGGVLIDVRGNSGGYDPNILTTFLRGMWSSSDFYVLSRSGKRLVPPVYSPLPVALLVNSGTASAGEALALKFRAHRIGPIVGEATAGMASAGADARRLSDGSMLWFAARAIEGLDGKAYEGNGVEPDVPAPDRPAAAPGEEDTVVEAGIKALAEGKGSAGNR